MSATATRCRGTRLLKRLPHGPHVVRVGRPRPGGALVAILENGDVVTLGSPWPALLRRCAVLLALLIVGAALGYALPTATACGAYVIGTADARWRG